MSSQMRCSRCGAELPPGSAGPCPHCEQELGFAAAEADSASTATGASRPPPRSDLPSSIGPYRILDLLGEGGMGIVYLAEQTGSIRRRVAVKVIRPGMDSRQVLARFEAERQALAVMTHPNVARVFDAGTTDEGRPYFVMEYVPGVRITEYCDMRCLPMRERLELFTRVCEAVHHAHQKGVIHRDLKPSNVLVSTDDGKPVPKVIDFGLAKATGRQLTEQTLFTREGILIGTPEYMSPEQAGATGLPVDARTDIYSLGVLLYELLVGALPFEPSTLRHAAAVEMLRIIHEEEPPRPATRFGSLGDTATDVARRRHTDVRSLARALRGDLEWITMRSIEKDPARRYPSASELAADVRRHLDDEPVLAGPPSRSYRFRKFARKHRAGLAGAAVSLAVLVAALIVTSAMYLRSEAARGRAVAEARRNQLEAEAIQAALMGDPLKYQQVSREAMDLHRLALRDDPARLSLYAVNRLTLLELLSGGFWSAPAPYENPASLKREALDLVNHGLDRRDPRAVQAAALLADMLDPSEATSLARRALAASSGAADDGALFESREALVKSLEVSSAGPMTAADDEALESVYRDSLTRRESVLPRNAVGLIDTRKSLAAVLERRAARLMRTGDPAAGPLFREALAQLRDAGLDRTPRAEKIRSDLSACLVARGKTEEAEDLLLQVIAALAPQRGENNGTVQEARSRLASLYGPTRPAAAARAVETLPPVFVETTSEIGPLLLDQAVTGAEGGRSVLFAGRSVWIFGETAIPGGEPPRRSATVAWTDRLDAAAGLTLTTGPASGRGLPADLLPLTKDEEAFNSAHAGPGCLQPCGARLALAPMATIADPKRNRILFFYTRSLLRAPDPKQPAGASLAVWAPANTAAQRLLVRPGESEPTLLFGADEPAWGSAALVVGEDLHVWACAMEGLGAECRLARVPLADAFDRKAWRFYGGNGRWSKDWRDARPVMDGGIQWGVMSVHWNAYLARYLAVSSRVVDSRIRIRMAERPEGPWSDPPIEIDTLHSEPGWFWTNWGLAHPELSPDGGRTEYFTYRRNVGNRHEIRLVEVRFGKK